MSDNRAVIVGDAHLYHPQNSRTDRLFHGFLEQVPRLGNHLVMIGDLFEFWFEYRSVIPKGLFPTLARIADVQRRGVQLTFTGGNHDRWGGTFWRDQLNAHFEPETCDTDLAGWKSTVIHGDGIGERKVGARLLHWLTRRKITATGFRIIHPDLGIWAVSKMSGLLGNRTGADQIAQRAAVVQEAYARAYLTTRPDRQLLVMGHTHRPKLVEVDSGRWYLNPGPWMEEARYATVGPEGPALHVFDG